MTITFVDTSAVYAVLNEQDPNHTQALQRWRDMVARGVPLAVSGYTVMETIALLQRRIGIPAVRFFAENMLSVLAVEWTDEGSFHEALDVLLTSTAGRRGRSLTDCANIVLMRKLGILTIFAYDKHYDEPEIRVIG